MVSQANNIQIADGGSLVGALCSPLSEFKALCDEFRSLGHRLRMCSKVQANASWPIIFGSSPWFPQKSAALLIIRLTLALTFIAHDIARFFTRMEKGYFFIYLTNWSILIQTVYLVFAAYTAYAAWTLLNRDTDTSASEAVKLPWFVCTAWALQHIAVPSGLLICVLYWVLDNPIYNLKYVPDYQGLFVHGFNFLLLLFDLLLGRNVFYIKHCVWFVLYMSLFCLWTLIHFVTKIGNYKGCDDLKKGYARDECPIYPVLDWHNVIASLVLAAIILFCAVPLCQYPIWCCVYRRNLVDVIKTSGNKAGELDGVTSSGDETAPDEEAPKQEEEL